MRVTSKGQVTIPQSIREKYGIAPCSEVEFVEEDGRVFLRRAESRGRPDFGALVGVATVDMGTEEIMRLTRSDDPDERPGESDD